MRSLVVVGMVSSLCLSCIEHAMVEAGKKLKYDVYDHPATKYSYDATYEGTKLHWYALYCGEQAGGHTGFDPTAWQECMASSGFNVDELGKEYMPFGRPLGPEPRQGRRSRFGRD